MKVLHVIPAVAARYGGPSRVVFEMARALSACGIEVLIATTNADGPCKLDVITGEAINFQGTETIFFPQRLSERFSYSPALRRWLGENVPSFDVVHIHAVFSHPCLAAANACQPAGVAYVVRPLGSLDPWSMRQKSWRKRVIWQLSARRMLDQAAAIHYTTKEEKRLAESTLGLERGVVIPLGIETDVEQAKKPNRLAESAGIVDGPYILVLSRLHPKKNLESLIEAFVSLSTGPEYSHWRLAIAGDGAPDYVARLRELAEKSGARERITFTGWLTGAEKNDALRNAQLLALTSRQENFGLCVAEALACGVAVVVSDRVNLSADVQAANAGWVTGLAPEEIEATLKEAMRDAAERARRGRAGREFAHSHLSWTKAGGELVDLYQSVAGQPEEFLMTRAECERLVS